MLKPLAAAERALDDALGPGTSEQHIVRVDVRERDGIVLTTDVERVQRWFRWKDERLVELAPAEDDRLPVASRIDAETEVLAWRPGRRMVLRSCEGIRKGYRSGRMHAACARQRRAELHLDNGVGTPVIESSDTQSASWVAREVFGDAVAVTSASAQIFESIGRGLRRVQRAPLDGLGEHGVDEELALLVRAAQRFESVRPVPDGVDRALEDLRRTAVVGQRPGSQPPVFLHRDLHDGQLLTEDGRVYILDFDIAAAGDPALDLGNLTAHLQLRALQGWCGASQARAEECASALLEGYASTGSGFYGRLSWYQASTFLRLALVYDLRPRWRPLSPTLISMSRRCARQVAFDPTP
ncbi:MAG: phosphotransferase [bacterium]|nr:phosphotransferase [bacterium]